MRKTKPQFVILGVVFIAIAVILSVILVVKALSGNTDNKTHIPYTTATQAATESATTIAPTISPTQSGSKLTATDIVKLKGLTVDRDGNVTDNKGIKYKVVDGKVKIVYNGELYTIYLNTLKRSNTTGKDNKNNTSSKNTSSKNNKKNNTSSKSGNTSSRSQSSDTTSSKTDVAVSEDTSSVTQSNSQNSNNNNYQNNGSHSQSSNIVKPNGNNTSQNNNDNNVKLSYSSLTVKVTSIFSLSISGTDGKVAWNVADTDIVRCYQYGGTQCSFRTIKKGSTQVIATYNGKNYYCNITVN